MITLTTKVKVSVEEDVSMRTLQDVATILASATRHAVQDVGDVKVLLHEEGLSPASMWVRDVRHQWAIGAIK